MNTKTIIKIQPDYNSNLSYDFRNDEISYLLEQLNLCCEIRNKNYINIVEQNQKNSSHKEDFKDVVTVNAVGYSQREWQDYLIYFNKKETDYKLLDNLIKLLERTFTHQNDYIATKYEQTEINGKIFTSEPIDCTNFCITNIEFPEYKDIENEYINTYGEYFDEIALDID